VDKSIHPLLDSSQFSISKKLAIVLQAASVDWLDARNRISATIRADISEHHILISQNFSIISAQGLLPKTCKTNVTFHHLIPKQIKLSISL